MFLRKMIVNHYGCLREMALEPSPLHALIGPNDSGKSTILRSAKILGEVLEQAATPRTGRAIHDVGIEPQRKPRFYAEFDSATIDLRILDEQGWTLETSLDGRRARFEGKGAPSGAGAFDAQLNKSDATVETLRRLAGGPRLLRLDPDALRLESQLIPETEPVRFYDDRGHRLAGIYDAILNRGDDSFRQIIERVTVLFPTVKAIRLRNITPTTKALEVELKDGTRVPAKFVSEGLLYYLAFAAVQYLDPASMVLVEEPENGLHPIRIAEVMSVFRAISETTQVLIATHSPLVLNELTAAEVSVVTRTTEGGTKVRLLAEAANIAERSKVYSLGELWLSYANGVDESALFSIQKS